MSENISAKQLFQAGLTREQFIQKYSELRTNGENDDSSIFSEDFADSLGQIFDALNVYGNDNDVLEEAEITALQGLGDNDNTTLSEADLKALYTQMGKEIMTQHNTQTTPEDMYKKAMADGDLQSSTYIQDLGQQISVLQELISLRKFNSTSLQQNYQAMIDDIVKKDSSLTLEQKTEYTKLSQELKELQKNADKLSAEIKQTELEIRNKENEIKIVQLDIDKLNPDDEKDAESIQRLTKELNSLTNEKDDLNFTLNKLTTKQNTLTTQLKSKKHELDDKSEELKSNNPALKAKIQSYEELKKNEEKSSEKEIADYEKQISFLKSAQDYAIEQLKNAPAPTENQASSDEASHQNDNLMSFDELKAQGLTYSSSKGQNLASTVQRHLKGFTGYCSRHVSNALAESGLGHERAGSAADMDTLLEKNQNFKEIKVTCAEDLKRLPAGCILVYERGAARYSAKHGHIEVTLGDGTAGSDGRTRNLRYTENMSVFVPVESA